MLRHERTGRPVGAAMRVSEVWSAGQKSHSNFLGWVNVNRK